MALVENFYDGDRARDIRELLSKNFANVSKYIPNDFLTLTTIERQNLTDDYKVHFKLVFDSEKKRVYKWSDIQRNWEQYLIYAWDDYARKEANENSASSFASVELGINESGQADPYTFTFYSRAYNETDGSTGQTIYHPEAAKDSISLTGENVKYNNNFSVKTIIDKIIDDFNSLNNFVGTRTDITNNADLTATTVCGAIKEINQKALENKQRLDNIENGVTKVPEAIHAENADLATRATMAADSELLGGNLPSYYASQQGLNNISNLLDSTIDRVEVNESNITDLQNKTDLTNSNLDALDAREQGHYGEFVVTRNQVNANTQSITSAMEDIAEIQQQLGWEILLA